MRMRISIALALVGACLHVSHAAPAQSQGPGVSNAAPPLRLIQTSEGDDGTWTSEEDYFVKYISKKIGFVDVTDSVQADKPTPAALELVSYPSQVEHVDEANDLISKVSTDRPRAWLQTFTDFHTRHFRTPTGKEAAFWLFNEVKSVAMANPAITVRQFIHADFDQPSVIAQIPGESSNLVILGAHLDSTGGSRNAPSPGADDDGSGTVVVLEALRVIASTGYKPRNTLEFHFYAAEEAGLLGSGAIFRDYKASGRHVLAMLAQDMTGYSPSERLSVVTDFVHPNLTEYVKIVATAYSDKPPSTTTCGYGCSDHYSAVRNGFPGAFVFEDEFKNHNPSIHSPEDTIDKIQWPSVLRHAKFSVGFMVEASYLGHSQPSITGHRV